MNGVNKHKGDPNYDLFRLALKSTSKRLYPNYANVDWSGNAGYDINDPKTYFSTMGCRTANGWDANGFGQLKDGRGNIAPVTIILPKLAMQVKNRADVLREQGNTITEENVIEMFLKHLDKNIYDAKIELIERFNWIASQNASAARFMYENNTMAGYVPEEGIISALKHGTLAIGQIGLAETLEILIHTNQTTEKGMTVAKKIESLFKNRCAEFKKEVHVYVDINDIEHEYYLNFGVYYTPAENLCYTAMEKFKKEFGIIPKVSDRDYFTNSIHVPVWEKVSPFEKIDIESQLTGYSSAGCITYVECDGGMQNNIDGLETLVIYAMDHDIPYFAINVPNDTCLDCGYTGEFNDKCPICNSKNYQQIRRVTGYLTGDYKSSFNNGKISETEDRVKHSRIIENVEGFNVNFNDLVNGNDVSISVFMNGCPHKCKGCFNQELWEYKKDTEMTDDVINKILDRVEDNGIKRNLSVLGGEPLCPDNLNDTFRLIKAFNERYPDKLVYVWTGYTIKQLSDMFDKLYNDDGTYYKGLLNGMIDILIDGKYEESLRDLSLPLRGSSNQNIINLREIRLSTDKE